MNIRYTYLMALNNFKLKALDRRGICGERSSGFALIATLSVLILLALIAVGILSLSSITVRTASQGGAMDEARANARMALVLAISELQKAAGPDQRVTAVADILSSNGGKEPIDGRSRWVGVWDTSDYDPSDPDNKRFVKWLVSAEDSTGLSADNATNGLVINSDNEVDLFKAVDAGGAVVASNSVTVEKVKAGETGSYAYWVEDEGVKADLSWNEGEFDSDERKQSARLSSAPGPDPEVFGGLFAGEVSYPIEADGSVDSWPTDLEKINSVNDSPLLVGASGDNSDWLKSIRHEVTLGSRAVLCDVKKGGLRRDLSLAFEMDADSDISATSQPERFNEQDGEFVGGTDKFASSQQVPGMNNVKERYLYRETQATGGHFSGAIVRSEAVMRGPTWWALRDYYSLYKRLSGTSGNYALGARSYYPNRTEVGGSLADMLDTAGNWGDYWDLDQRTPGDGLFAGQSVYLHRPATSNYAPVNLGTTTLISVLTTNFDAADGTAELAIALDPVFYLWNPYNRNLEFESIAVYLETGLPGTVDIKVTGADPDVTHTVNLAKLLEDNLENFREEGLKREFGKSYSFLIRDEMGDKITLAPGEVVAASPSVSGTGESYLGYDPLDNSSGLILTKINGNVVKVKMDSQTQVNVGLYNFANRDTTSVRFFIETNIPPSGATAAQIAETNTILGEQTQSFHTQLSSKKSEYVVENQTVFNPGSEPTTSALLDAKTQFGLFTYLMKPANWSGNGANPVEVFSRFNPAAMIISKDYWGAAGPNQVFNFVASSSANELINNNGFNFSPSARNAFWGKSYDSSGSESVPMSNIPSVPLLSLADFAHANICIMASDPFHAIGNSWSNPAFTPLAPYGNITTTGGSTKEDLTGADLSWLSNDALFDRYYLSGIAPAYTIGSTGYNATGTLKDRLEEFYGSDHKSAEANPVIEPYIPEGGNVTDIVADLDPNDTQYSGSLYQGYKELGAYALIKGAFNINSTSVNAWKSLLRANRALDVSYAQAGGLNTSADGTPFPSSNSPSAPGNGATANWSGLSRITDAQIDTLATHIVEQVKSRGPFMSISNFVNRKVGGNTVTDDHYTGAIQAAIDEAGFNNAVRAAAGGVAPSYYEASQFTPDVDSPAGSGGSALSTGAGTPMDITQADLLRSLAPRMNARSDTFRIRSYGEAHNAAGEVIATAICEAVVQRMPEYVEQDITANGNMPWDDADSLTSERPLSAQNSAFGRRFQIQSFRWLSEGEI